MLKQKEAQNIAISVSHLIFTESYNGQPKVAQMAKKSPNLVTL
jgi:hypothetical protein